MKHVFLDWWDNHGHILMSDLEKHRDCVVIYTNRLHDNMFINSVLYHVMYGRLRKLSAMINRKCMWRLMFNHHIDSETRTIALTTSWYDKEFLYYLKNSYPRAKLILIMRDTVLDNTKRNRQFIIEEAKEIFDLVLSYDNVHDVPTYGLTFAPVFMSQIDASSLIPMECKYDVAFIAEAKDRLSTIHSIYNCLVANGVKSYFYIFKAKKTEQLSKSGIIYADKYLDRTETLQKELESNCILEVLKGDAYSNTLRFWEAIMYNKKFYTNWKGVVDSPYYNPRFVRVFDNPENLDCDFIKERIDVDYHYHGELSPVRLLDIFKENLKYED